MLRGKNKLSQEKLAELLNVTRQTISTWEENLGRPDIYMLASIHDIFDVPTDTLLFGKIQENSLEIVSGYAFSEEVQNDYIRSINKEGVYDIIDEDLNEFFPIIYLPFARIMAIALELNKRKYNIVTIYGNRFGIYLSTDIEAKKFVKDLYNIIDSFIHHEEGRIAVDYLKNVQERIDEVEITVLNETRKEMFGEGLLFYWIDEHDRIRGHDKNEDECISQTIIQKCINYTILQE